MRALYTFFICLTLTAYSHAQDASLTSSLSPINSGCMVGTADEDVVVTITNIGLADIPAGCLQVYYSVNGLLQESKTLNETVSPFTTNYFPFSNTVDLSLCGTYTIKVWVSSGTCNTNNINDTLTWVYENDCPNVVTAWADGDTLKTDISGGADWYDCDNQNFAGSSLDGTFLPPYQGTFRAISTSTHCVDTTNCFNMLTASLEEEDLLAGEALFGPNPTTEQVWLNDNLNGEATVEIYSMEGRLIRRMDVSELSGKTLSLDGMSPGSYILTVVQGQDRLQEVLVKR